MAALVLACACVEQAPSVQAGAGYPDFCAWAPGAQAQVVRGPQGGWHLLVDVRATGTPSEATVTAELWQGGQPIAGFANQQRAFQIDDDGAYLVQEPLVSPTFDLPAASEGWVFVAVDDDQGQRVQTEVFVQLSLPDR